MTTTLKVRVLAVVLTLAGSLAAPRGASAQRLDGCPITVWADASAETEAYCDDLGYSCSSVSNCGDNGHGGYAYDWQCIDC
jgi:hypothetical protein